MKQLAGTLLVLAWVAFGSGCAATKPAQFRFCKELPPEVRREILAYEPLIPHTFWWFYEHERDCGRLEPKPWWRLW